MNAGPAKRLGPMAVEVVSNKRGWYVNYSVNGVPSNSYGPMEGPITLAQGLRYVAMMLDIETN